MTELSGAQPLGLNVKRLDLNTPGAPAILQGVSDPQWNGAMYYRSVLNDQFRWQWPADWPVYNVGLVLISNGPFQAVISQGGQVKQRLVSDERHQILAYLPVYDRPQAHGLTVQLQCTVAERPCVNLYSPTLDIRAHQASTAERLSAGLAVALLLGLLGGWLHLKSRASYPEPSTTAR